MKNKKTAKYKRDMEIIRLATCNKDVKDVSCGEIARRFNISRQRVEQILKKYNVTYDAHRPLKHIKEAVELYENGILIKDIESKIGKRCASTILKKTQVRRGMGYHRKTENPSDKILDIFNKKIRQKMKLKDIARIYDSSVGSISISMVRARKRWGEENILNLIS